MDRVCRNEFVVVSSLAKCWRCGKLNEHFKQIRAFSLEIGYRWWDKNASRQVGNETEYYPSVRGHPDLHFYELVYGMFIIVIILSSLTRSFFFIQVSYFNKSAIHWKSIEKLWFGKASLRASSLLHNRLLVKVFLSPMEFFDSTPVGRILNIFSRDLDESKLNFTLLFQFY